MLRQRACVRAGGDSVGRRESRQTTGEELEPPEQPHVRHEGAFPRSRDRILSKRVTYLESSYLTAGQARGAGPA